MHVNKDGKMVCDEVEMNEVDRFFKKSDENKEGIGEVFDSNYFARRDKLKETCKAVYDGAKESGVYEILGHRYIIHKTGTYSQMTDKG